MEFLLWHAIAMTSVIAISFMAGYLLSSFLVEGKIMNQLERAVLGPKTRR